MDARRAHFHRDALGQARDGVLGGDIGAVAGGGLVGRGGGHHDHRAGFLFDQRGRGVFHRQHDGKDIEHVGLLKQFEGHILNGMGLALITGVGHDDVQRAKPGLGGFHQVFDVRFVVHVGHEACDLTLRRLQGGQERVDLGLPGG